MKPFYEECTASTGVDEGLIVKARKGDFTSDPKLHQFFYCIFSKTDLINEESELQLEALKRKIPDSMSIDIDQIAAVCMQQKGEDKYETVYLMYQCFFNNTPHKANIVTY